MGSAYLEQLPVTYLDSWSGCLPGIFSSNESPRNWIPGSLALILSSQLSVPLPYVLNSQLTSLCIPCSTSPKLNLSWITLCWIHWPADRSLCVCRSSSHLAALSSISSGWVQTSTCLSTLTILPGDKRTSDPVIHAADCRLPLSLRAPEQQPRFPPSKDLNFFPPWLILCLWSSFSHVASSGSAHLPVSDSEVIPSKFPVRPSSLCIPGPPLAEK